MGRSSFHSGEIPAVILLVSIIIPRKVSLVDGPLIFEGIDVHARWWFQQKGYFFSTSLNGSYHICTITFRCMPDLDWWLASLPTWNGTSHILETGQSTSPSISLFTDVSDTLGWGAYWSGNWIQARWSPDQIDRNITWKELFAIASAINTQGHQQGWTIFKQ